jgi:hypothetical protein
MLNVVTGAARKPLAIERCTLAGLRQAGALFH